MREYPHKLREYPYKLRGYPHELREYPHKLREYPHELREYPYELREYPYKLREYPYKLREYSHELREYPYGLRESKSGKSGDTLPASSAGRRRGDLIPNGVPRTGMSPELIIMIIISNLIFCLYLLLSVYYHPHLGSLTQNNYRPF